MISIDDLITAFGEREINSLLKHEQKTPNLPTANKAIARSEALILSYLHASGMELKALSAGSTDILKHHALDICRYYLHENNAPPIVKERFDWVIRWFEQLMRNPKLLATTGTNAEDESASAEKKYSGMLTEPNKPE